MSVLVIAEHDNHKLRTTTLTTLAAARKCGDDIHVLVAGFNCAAVVDALRAYAMVRNIVVADHECYQHQLAEVMAPFIKSIASDYTHVLIPATTFGKNILPRVAALLDVGMISDVIEIIDHNTYKRPIYAGNAIATVKSEDALQCVSVRPSAFDHVAAQAGEVVITQVATVFENNQSEWIAEEKHAGDRPELVCADIIIAGGRGVGDTATFDQLIAIADRMGAAVGASRAAVDSGLAPNDFQVGQTGQVVSPKLYFAIGISGAIQHLAGMKDSSVIVAINKDADAPIFEVADYGLVADLKEVLCEWTQYLDK